MTLTTEAVAEIERAAAPRRPEDSRPAISAARREMLLLIAASLLATIPVWLASFPPMVDLPEHAAQIAMLRNLHNPGFPFAKPVLGELVHTLPARLHAGVCIHSAARRSLLLPNLSLPSQWPQCLLRRLCWRKRPDADRYWALLTIPAMYGFSYSWGFLNFLVATPIGLLFLVMFMRHTRKPSLRSSVYVALFSILLFFSHALTYFVLRRYRRPVCIAGNRQAAESRDYFCAGCWLRCL